MNQCQQLHETIVRDVIDVMDNVKNFDQIEWLGNRNNVGSIAKRASNLTLVFPVICSTNITIQTASIISKAIERKCVSLLQILFSSVQLVDADNLYDYIRRFHTNLDLKSGIDLDDFMHVMDKMVDEGAVNVTDYDAYEAVKEDMHNINYYLSRELNPVSINDYRMRVNAYGESYVVCEAKGKGDTTVNNMGKYAGNNVQTALNSNNKNTTINNINNSLGKNKGKYDISLQDHTDYFRYQLMPQDVQKANELMPTIMMVNFTTINNTNDKVGTTTGVIGVKAKLYPVESMDIINRLSSKFKDSNGLFNLIRATTREISFFRDLAFAIDKAKIDAVNISKNSNNARMFRILERRAKKNKFSSLVKKNDASPITSLIISQDEVEYLKKYNSLDMEKPYVTRSILESFNLMDIIIADESLETAKFLFDDGDGVFDVLPFDSLEKEAKDSSYKKVINLMSRINR